MRVCKVGYDEEVLFDIDELEAMYIDQGKSPMEASELANSLCREMRRMVFHDRYSWKKFRKHEIRGWDLC